jgi:hypothetical protein
MKIDNFNDPEIHQKGQEIEIIGNSAVSRAIEENKKLGIPTVYSINGTILYELPDGKVTTQSPFDM